MIVDRTRKRAEAVASDLRFGAPLCPMTTVVDGDYENLANSELEGSIRYANITIIEGNDASPSAFVARITEMVLRDERAVVPIGSFNKNFGVTPSLPSVVGRGGMIWSFEPEMSGKEHRRSRRAPPI